MAWAGCSLRSCRGGRLPLSLSLPLLVMLLLLMLSRSSSSPQPPSPPNVILLLIDDAGYGDLPSSPRPQSSSPRTLALPHIASVARRGASFLHTYVTAPQCSPSRAAILTGKYQQRFGHETNAEFLAALTPTSTRLIPQLLPPAAQYRSAMIGKWNLGDVPHSPLKHGFDELYLYRACEDVYGTHVKGSAAPPSAAGGAGAGAGGRDRRYCTTSMFERAVQFITSCSGNSSNGTAATETGASRESTSGAKEGQQQSQMRQGTTRPFFLYLSPLSPHPPFIFPPAYQPLFDSLSPSIHITRRKVMTMMREIDDGLGSLLAALESSDSLNNTILLLLSDNGAPDIFGPPGGAGAGPNFPFRGHKGDLLDGGVHMKMLMQWPAVVSPHQVVRARVSSLDLLPTILHAASFPPSYFSSSPSFSDSELDGTSLLPLLHLLPSSAPVLLQRHRLRGHKELEERVLYWRFNASCREPLRAALRGSYKWLRVGEGSATGGLEQLYDLSRDQNETFNLLETQGQVDYRQFRAMADALAGLHAAWEAKLPPMHSSAPSRAARRRECDKRQQQATRNKNKSKDLTLSKPTITAISG